MIDFSFMPKIIRTQRSCFMKIVCKFPTVNISKLNFWLVICIAKNFIWTALKAIFSIIFFCTLRFLILNSCISAKYRPLITYINGKFICSAFRWSINLNFEKWTLMTCFVVQGHIWVLSEGSCDTENWSNKQLLKIQLCHHRNYLQLKIHSFWWILHTTF